MAHPELKVRELNELHQLDDDAFVNTAEAAAVVGLKYKTLKFYRARCPEFSPKYYCVGGRAVRYRMGDLRAFRTGDPNARELLRSGG